MCKKIAFTAKALTLLILLALVSATGFAGTNKTWKTIEEMTKEELADWKIAPGWSAEAPRHKEFPHLPAEIYPFEPPFTGEEITFLAEDIIFPGRTCKNEGAHVAAVNKRGHMLQFSYMFKTKFYYDGFAEKLYKLQPGDIEVQHLLVWDFPPEERGRGLLLQDLKDTPDSPREQERWM